MIRQYHATVSKDMDTSQWSEFLDELKKLGDNKNDNPSRRNHWRYSLDNQVVIFEGLYNPVAWGAGLIAARLFKILDIQSPRFIHTETTLNQYGQLIVYSVDGVDVTHMLSFGGASPQYWVSQKYAQDYLRDNLEDWEEDIL